MRKIWNGIASLPLSIRPWTRTAGVALLAMAAGFLMLAPAGTAQTPDAENAAAATAAANQGVTDQAAPSRPAQANHQAPVPGTQKGDNSAPKDIRVVRLSDVEGSVQIMRGDQTEFSQAVMNMPVLQGSRIVTGADGRAEIEFEDGSVARITPDSSLTLDRLAITPDGTFNTAVDQLSGLIYYELRSDPRSPYKVIAGDQAITPTLNSTFRVNLGVTPPAVSVLDGGVHVEGAQGSYQADVKQGQTIQFGVGNGSKYTVADGIMPNGFDEWNDQRDQEAAQQAQNQTPARLQQGGGSMMDSGYGWSDLDNAGGWYPLPGYGMVWQPYGAGPGFNPYGYGMWANYPGLGYSWISGYSWGWLPFNCGMWNDIDGFGWGWMPGGCGGFGIGFGYGWYGRRWRHGYRGLYPHTNIAHAPAGYRAPAPPLAGKGETAPRIVRVGTPSGLATGTGPHVAPLHNHVAPAVSARTVHFNGTKIAPLHSMTAGIQIPIRNAALYNNYSARTYPGGIRTAMLNTERGTGREMASGRSGAIMARGTGAAPARLDHLQDLQHESVAHGSVINGPIRGNRSAAFSVAHGEPLSGQGIFGNGDRANQGNRAAFGQHTSFGPRGGFGGAHSAFSNGGSFRGGNTSSGFRGAGGGFRGGGGGFHGGGGGFSGGAHAGGGGFSGGGGHASGGGGGGGGHSH